MASMAVRLHTSSTLSQLACKTRLMGSRYHLANKSCSASSTPRRGCGPLLCGLAFGGLHASGTRASSCSRAVRQSACSASKTISRNQVVRNFKFQILWNFGGRVHSSHGLDAARTRRGGGGFRFASEPLLGTYHWARDRLALHGRQPCASGRHFWRHPLELAGAGICLLPGGARCHRGCLAEHCRGGIGRSSA